MGLDWLFWDILLQSLKIEIIDRTCLPVDKNYKYAQKQNVEVRKTFKSYDNNLTDLCEKCKFLV
jgi:hypothetical protein